MIVRRFYKSDYQDIVKWWKHQDRAILSWEILPVLGFICEDDTERLCCCWLYCTDSVTGFVSWTTTNPEAKRRKIASALKLMREATESAAKTANIKILFQFSGGGGFSRLLLRSGWKNSMIKHDFLMKEI